MFLELHAHTRRSRAEIVSALKDAISDAGGWITGYHEYSNKSVCLNFEIGEHRCGALAEGLGRAPCVLTPASVEALAIIGRRECNGTLQVTLIHDDPDEKSVIPAVPG